MAKNQKVVIMSIVSSESVNQEQLHLQGVIDRIAFHNEDNGFTVLRVTVKGGNELATVVGVTALVKVGDHIDCQGVWANDRTHGVQFRADQISVIAPTTLDGIERYLASGADSSAGGSSSSDPPCRPAT